MVLWKGHERKKIQNRSAILNFFSREPPLELSYRGGCKTTSIYVGVSKTFILSISGPWDLLETIPRAISDRMVRVPSDFVSSRAILGQNKVPRALSTSDVFLHVQKPPWHESGVPDFLHKKPSNFEKKEGTPLSFPGGFSTTLGHRNK